MLKTIALKEFTDTLRDGRFRVAAVLVGALLVVSVLVSRHYYQTVSRQHEQAKRTARYQWENQGSNNPHSAAHYGVYAFKPKYPLSMLDNGLDKYLGVSLFLEAHRQNESQFKAIEDSSALARFGELTPAFVLIYLVPLLIVLMAFGAFTSEKESGNLRLVLSQGLSRRTWLLGKLAGVWLVLLTLVVPLFLIGLLFLAASPGADGGEFARFGLLALVLLLYFAVFVNVSVGVSAWAANSNGSLVLLLGFWMLSTLVLPKATTNLARRLYPAPSALAYQAALEKDLKNGVDGHDSANEFSKKFERETLAKYGVDSVSQLPFNYWGLAMQAGEEHEEHVFDKHTRAIQDLYRRQLAVHQASAFLSPTILTRLLSMSLARTDLEAHYHFQQEAENYRIRLVRDLNYELKDHSKYDDWEYQVNNDFFRKTARFDYQPVTLAYTTGQTAGKLVFLLGWVLVSLAGAWWAAAKLNG
ncbi:MAG: DUF3526 domain-containing protein [Ferruginibacter sp.]|nr:DUF3526 domain-containing protein [Cytophagales bacterium]